MGRRASDVALMVNVSTDLRRRLGEAALDLQPDVERDRVLERGPMVAYVLAWFLEQARGRKLEIVRGGQAAYHGKPGGGEPGAAAGGKAAKPKVRGLKTDETKRERGFIPGGKARD